MARWAGALLSLAVAAIHVVDQGGITATRDPYYIGVAYHVLEIAAVVTAVLLLIGLVRLGWLLAAGVALGPLLGYILSRSSGLPDYSDDVGNWTEPLGLFSLAVEGTLLLLSVPLCVRSMRRRTPRVSGGRERVTATGRKQLQHPRSARQYLKIAAEADRRGGATHRDRLLAGLTGRVLEVGAGQGRNFLHYPRTVAEVVALEPDDTLRTAAEQTAASAPVPVTVVPGEASGLPGENGEFDAVVASLVLCSVEDVSGALAEMFRVLRSGGELRFYEHVRSPRRWAGWLEDAITPLWSRAGGGCHPNRDAEAAIRHSGFTIREIDRFGFSFSPFVPKTQHIVGTAVRL